MAQFVLEILDGDRAGEVVSLGDATIRIGRKPTNDLVLADEKASGVHAEIVPEGGRFVLRDLGSTNGTLMDGRKVSEVVLSNGDAFMVGRVRLCFRAEGEEAAVPEGMQVGRIDAARLQSARSSRSVGLLAVLLLVAVAASGYMWWRGGAAAPGTDGRRAAAGPREPLQVPGNRLPNGQGSCEAGSEESWDLRLAGAGFALDTAAHTGTGGLAAQRGAAAAGEADADVGFAVAASASVAVLPGRSLTITAHLRTMEGGRAAVRAWFYNEAAAQVGGQPQSFQFRSGSAFAEYADWSPVQFAIAAPTGADRCRVEVVAVLPQEGSRVFVDDVALVEAGEAAESRQKIERAGTLLAVGGSFAVGSMDPDEPVTLHGVEPLGVADDLQGLAHAGLLTLSDVGATLRHEADDRSCTIAVDGCSAIALVFPGDSAGGLMVEGAGDDSHRFASSAAAATFEARRVLLGNRGNRCMVELDQAASMVGRARGGLYRLELPVASCRLVLAFRAERDSAGRLMRSAQADADAGRPGAALNSIRELVQTVPHDVEMLSRALALRTELEEALAARLQRLAESLDEAAFFETRGGFQRVVQDLDDLLELYGEQNLPDPPAVAAMRQTAATRLAELDGRRSGELRQRLEGMAAAFEAAQKDGLARVVRAYVAEHLKNP